MLSWYWIIIVNDDDAWTDFEDEYNDALEPDEKIAIAAAKAIMPISVI